MLKQFAPIAVMPPSPKKIAWIISAIGNRQDGSPRSQHNRRDAHAHRVPRGAARQRQVEHHDDEGKRREHRQQRHRLRVQAPLHCCSETYQNGAEPAYNAAQVEGLRYPSGMCMLSS